MLPDGSWETYPNAVEAMTALGETITSLLPDGYEIVVDGQIILTGGEAVDPQVLMNILTNPAQLNRIIEELNKVEVPEELREQGLNLFKMVGLAVTEGQIPEGAVDAGVDLSLIHILLDIVGDQAAKMGLENAFETAMAEAGTVSYTHLEVGCRSGGRAATA